MYSAIKKYFQLSPFISFLPFLLVFVLLVMKLHNDAMEGDEWRYYQFASNLIHGFYSPPPPDINLWNGPGYPIILIPFVAFNAPLIFITLFNALLHYLSIVLLFLTLKRHFSYNNTILISFFWACYYIAYQEIPYILTEPLSTFLVTAVLYSSSLMMSSFQIKRQVLCGIIFGFLILTKIIFSYILLILLPVCFILYLLQKNPDVKKILVSLCIAFLLNLPYLGYTYSLTGKLFYWGNSGGLSLYWMTSPYEEETGDWENERQILDTTDLSEYRLIRLRENHYSELKQINTLKGVEKDNAYKQAGINNIKAHPLKYLRNCISNVSRIFFGIPFSYCPQQEQTIKRFLINSILLTFTFLMIFLIAYNWTSVPVLIRFAFITSILYLCLSIIVSAFPRQLYIIVPMLLFCIGYVFEKNIKISLYK